MPWPQPADAASLLSLARETFRQATAAQPFRVSRVVLALQYADAGAVASAPAEKKRRAEHNGVAAQSSILQFVGRAAAQTGVQGHAAASASAAPVKRGTLSDYFAPSTASDSAAAAQGQRSHSQARIENASGYVLGGGEGFDSNYSNNSNKQEKKQRKDAADVIIID